MADFATWLTNLVYAAVLAGTPLLFGTLGEIISEKAGCVNLGVEGMMWMGAVAGFYVAYRTDNLILAMLAAFLIGVVCALIFAFITITLQANQNVTGLTLTTFGIGLAYVLGFAMNESNNGYAPTLSPELVSTAVSGIHIPLLSDIPYIGKMFFQHNILVYVAVLLSVGAFWYFSRTRAGLNVRAVGENPAAADAAGVNVTLARYVHVLVGGGICAMGGAYMSIVMANGSWQTGGIVNGQGWIAVALVIFSSWSPAKVIFGSMLFGLFSRLQQYVPKSVVDIPVAIYTMLPFVLTTLVLIISSIRSSKKNPQPAANGQNYFREDR